jgi:hypothetical protein
MAVLITLLYGRSWVKFMAVLLTCIVLVALMGPNVSAIGLVTIPVGALYRIAEMFALIVALNVVYVVVFMALERRRLSSKMLSTESYATLHVNWNKPQDQLWFSIATPALESCSNISFLS